MIESPAPDDTPGQFDKLASVSIQGGAVYGLTLLGQLQAVVDDGYTIVALSGTSAGAIVAALYWAGLEPAEIRDHFAMWADEKVDGVSGILELLGSQVAGRSLDRAAVGRRMARLNAVTGGDAPQSRLWAALTAPWRWGKRAGAGLGLWRTAAHPGGLFPGDVFEGRIDALVREGLRRKWQIETNDLARPITFGDLWRWMEQGRAFFPALTLTATALLSPDLRLFDSTDPRYFDVPVARAVRASGGFPLFFRPVPITLPGEKPDDAETTDYYADGGIICNFPGFVFAGRARTEQLRPQRLYRPFVLRPWVNIGLRLEDAPTDRDATPPAPSANGVFGSLFGLLKGGTRTILETMLAQRTVERLTVCSCVRDESDPDRNEEGTGWRHTLLDFDRLDPAAVHAMFETGRRKAADVLNQLWFDLPMRAQIEPRLDRLVRRVEAALGAANAARLAIRATLFVPDGERLRLTYRSAGMTRTDPDFDLDFGYDQGLVGYVYVRRRPAICNLTALGQLPNRRELFDLPPDLEGRVRPDRTWVYGVPVYDPETADPYPPTAGEPPGKVSQHVLATLESPLVGALFGVLSIDAAVQYGTDMPAGPDAQLGEPAIQLVGSALLAEAWELGKIFSQHFAR